MWLWRRSGAGCAVRVSPEPLANPSPWAIGTAPIPGRLGEDQRSSLGGRGPLENHVRESRGEGRVAVSGSDRVYRFLEPGLRVVDHELFYSAAWLDDPTEGPEVYPERGLVTPFHRGSTCARSTRPEAHDTLGSDAP
jgi:hypothetical protein